MGHAPVCEFIAGLVFGGQVRCAGPQKERSHIRSGGLDLSQQGPEVRGFSPGYLFTKELIVIGSTLDVLLRAVDTVDGKLPALSSNARFSDLTKLATRNASYIVFADLSGLIGMVVDSLPADTRGDYEDNVGPFLDPFRLLLRGCNLQQ